MVSLRCLWEYKGIDTAGLLLSLTPPGFGPVGLGFGRQPGSGDVISNFEPVEPSQESSAVRRPSRLAQKQA